MHQLWYKSKRIVSHFYYISVYEKLMVHLITLHTKSSHSKAYSYIWNKWNIQKKMYTTNKPHILLCNVDLPASFLRHRERCTGWWVAYVEGKKGETQERDGRRSWGLKRRNEIWNLHWGLLNYNVTWLNRKPLIECIVWRNTYISDRSYCILLS